MRLVLLTFLVFAGSCVHCLYIDEKLLEILTDPGYETQKDNEYESQKDDEYGSQKDEIEEPVADKPKPERGKEIKLI